MRHTTRKKKMTPRQRKEVDTSTYSGRFAVRLRALRDKTGMSADAFAEKHGFARTTYYGWETGVSVPSLDVFPQLAEALGVTVRNLMPKG
jgi:transcriptional regulator with XRE-family HTH domain